MNLIDATFNASTVEAIMQNLKNDGSEWATKTFETLSKFSPTSMKITLKLLELGSEMDLQECLRIEYRLSQRCSEDHDFTEGSKCLHIPEFLSVKCKNASMTIYFVQVCGRCWWIRTNLQNGIRALWKE